MSVHDAEDQPLVNLYLEEAADLAVSNLLSDLLAQSREFGLTVTLAMRFPAQLREADAAGDVVVALEAERATHDLRRAAPADFDKLARTDPEAAIWVTVDRAAGSRSSKRSTTLSRGRHGSTGPTA